MNNVILIGRLVRDGELRFIPNTGQAIFNMMLAVDKGYPKEKKAELQAKGNPTADFIRVIAWGKLAENCANYLFKGSMCAVKGSIQTSTYKTNTGETRYSTDIKADTVEFLGGGDKQNQNDDSNHGNYNPDDFQAIQDDEDIPF